MIAILVLQLDDCRAGWFLRYHETLETLHCPLSVITPAGEQSLA
jgi:hypothetical protein